MDNITGIALTTSAMFLVVVAVMLNNPALFYMSTAMIATIGASRIQAWLSVRGLRFERLVPELVKVGDLVTVEITVWSERRMRRPLVTVLDNLPARLVPVDLSPSLPIAPAFDIPVHTQYRFRPARRGVFRWSGVRVAGTDALGLVTMERTYPTGPAEMTVLPIPIPVSLELPSSAAWGLSATEGSRGKGSGLEPRGTREYVPGDSLRHIHWRSSARANTLLVKEFEAGVQSSIAMLMQLTSGTDVGNGAHTTLELMFGHAAHLADHLLRTGASVTLPALEAAPKPNVDADRLSELLLALARAEANRTETLGEELLSHARGIASGTLILLAVSIQDPTLADAVRRVGGYGCSCVALLYDADGFVQNRRGAPSSVDPTFVRALQAAGARTVRMPLEGLGI